MRHSKPHKSIPALAALAAAALGFSQAATTARTPATARSAPAADTAYGRPYPDAYGNGAGTGNAGAGNGAGTGMGQIPGMGGSSLDSANGRDTLWSSPGDSPATPGTGLPNSPGSGWPATGGSGTGGTGSPGNGGSGLGGSGIGSGTEDDSAGSGPAAPALPGAPRDSIGAPDWMERG
jgi:hypothetical protein